VKTGELLHLGVLVVVVFVAWKIGGRWRKGYRDAVRFRAKLENTIAVQHDEILQLRSQLSVVVQVGDNARANALAGDLGRSELGPVGRDRDWAPGGLRAGPGRGLHRREALSDARPDELVQRVDDARAAGTGHDLVPLHRHARRVVDADFLGEDEREDLTGAGVLPDATGDDGGSDFVRRVRHWLGGEPGDQER
jgi:hypothetical protein